MRALTCAATRRRLDAFYDRELAIADQIAVAQHLEWCGECATISAELSTVGAALRACGSRHLGLPNEDIVGFNATVVNQLKAERDASIAARMRLMFEDMHLVYVGFSATVAATVCLVLMLGMMRFASDYRPDSLAAILNVMATPFECEAPSDFADAVACYARWIERFQRANESAEQDAVFTLDAMVIHDGQLANLAVLRASSRHVATGQAKMIEGLLDTVSRARSAAPPSVVSGTLLRVVARETVRATKPPAIDLPLPPTKPAASMTAGARAATA